jgi:hypothetical protein
MISQAATRARARWGTSGRGRDPHRLFSRLASSASRRLAVASVAVAALPVAACRWDCGTVRRTVANGTVRDAAGVTLAAVQVDLSENVGPSSLRLSAGVVGSAGSAGAPLKGHVTRARLVSDGGEVLAEIPTGTATLYVDAVVALTVDLASQAEYARVRSALLTTRAKVILDTDLPGRERIETTLSAARNVTGEVQRCTPA